MSMTAVRMNIVFNTSLIPITHVILVVSNNVLNLQLIITLLQRSIRIIKAKSSEQHLKKINQNLIIVP